MVDVIGWRLDDVVQLIRGKDGTVVRLQILPAGATPGTPERTLELTRNKVTLQTPGAEEGGARRSQRNGRIYKIGIITVPSFYNDMEDGRRRRQPTTAAPPTTCGGCCSSCRSRGRRRRAGAGSARRRRRLPARGHRPDAPVHQSRAGGAAASDTTGQLEVLDRAGSGPGLHRSAGGAGGPHQRLGLRDLRRRHPGLSPRPDHRPDHLRQGHGAERHSARSLVVASRPRDRSPSPSASSTASPARARSCAA